MVALAFSGQTVITLVWSLCAPSALPWVHWGGPGLAELQTGVCLTLFSGNTLCRPRHDPLLGITGNKTKDLGSKSVGFISTRGCLLRLPKAVSTPEDQTIGTVWQIPLHLPATDNWLPWSWWVMLSCCRLVVGMEKELNSHKSLIIVSLSTFLLSLSRVFVQSWFFQGLCLWAAWSSKWEKI